jgi:ADP-ribose pyrophosphatase YjhB (NUDIX family)
MANKSSITAISLPEKTEKVLQGLQSKLQKNRSELIREMINFYLKSGKRSEYGRGEVSNFNVDSTDTNKILKYYYQLISQSKPKASIVIGVVIINKKNRVLIGLRKIKDIHVKNLTWTFPSGKFSSLDFESEIIKTAKQETGFDVKVAQLVHARLIPDSPEKKIRIIALYYHCKIVSGKQKPGGDFKDLKWVPATEVTRHFTTSVSDEIMNFLGTL